MRRVTCHLRESNCGRSNCREATICMQFLSYNICISMLFLRDLSIVYSKYTLRSDIRPLYQEVAWKRSKTMKNSKTENRLREVPVIKLSGKMLVFERWSHVEVRLYSYFEKGSQKTAHATIPKGNMGYYNIPEIVAVEPTFYCFPLVLANVRPWPLVPFF